MHEIYKHIDWMMCSFLTLIDLGQGSGIEMSLLSLGFIAHSTTHGAASDRYNKALPDWMLIFKKYIHNQLRIIVLSEFSHLAIHYFPEMAVGIPVGLTLLCQ